MLASSLKITLTHSLAYFSAKLLYTVVSTRNGAAALIKRIRRRRFFEGGIYEKRIKNLLQIISGIMISIISQLSFSTLSPLLEKVPRRPLNFSTF